MFVSLTRQRMGLVIALALLAGLLSLAVFWKPASATTVPASFQDSLFASGLNGVTAMAFAPDGRLFVTEKQGRIRVIDQEGNLQNAPFVTIPNVDTAQTRGLLGIAFHPNFGQGTNEDYVYAHYTQEQTAGTHRGSYNRIVRFTVTTQTDPVSGEPIVVAKEQDGIGTAIFDLDPLGDSTTHDGGHIEFGNDGYLYIPVGDNKRNKMRPLLDTWKLTNLFGKVLRIDDEGHPAPGNPYVDKTTGKYEAIYAKGFRNPFSMAVRPAALGEQQIYINDVGEQTWEEINSLKAGANYGWPRYEGFEGDRRFKKPVYAYKQSATRGGGNCAISAGTFYYPPEGATTPFPAEYHGDYFFADLCAGWIRKLEDRKASGFATGASSPVDLKVGPDGGLYYLQVGGSVRVIRPAPVG